MKNKRVCGVAATFGVAAILFFSTALAPGATITLERKTIDSRKSDFRLRSESPDWMFRLSDEQSFHLNFTPQTVVKDGKETREWQANEDDATRDAFKKVVKKEPAKYHSEFPLRGVATLGDRKYGFVLDAPDAKTPGYGLLYLDRNGNGDLTDDEVIESDAVRQAREKANDAKQSTDEKQDKVREAAADMLAAAGQHSAEFPRIDLTIEIDGKKVEHPLFFTCHSYQTNDYAYAAASVCGGVYYEGQIDIDGRSRRVVLVDYNNNGRFDDPSTVNAVQYGPNQPARRYVTRGDVLYVDPQPVTDFNLIWDPAGLDFRHSVEKMICLDGKYQDLKVSPTGETLTLEPSKVPLGLVTSPNANYRAVLHGDRGVVAIKGTKDEAVALPVGEWKLVSYVIDLTDVKPADEPKPEKKPAADAKKKGGLWSALGKALGETAGESPLVSGTMPGQRRTTMVAASAVDSCPAVKVAAGETVVLPFGPPFTTTATISHYDPRRDTLYLEMEIADSTGALVTNMSINGGRPGKPKIKITDPDGKTVIEGDFEYG